MVVKGFSNLKSMPMYPVLFKFGGLPVYTHSIFIAIGLFTGLWVLKNDAARENVDPGKIMDLSFWLLLAAIFGSRFLYIATRPIEYIYHPLEIFKIWHGGFVYYGGFLAAWIAGFIYLKRNRIHFWKIADIMTVPLTIGLFFGRLGCFFVGCCYGNITELPWGVEFTHPDSLAPQGIPLHPTQIYLALINLFILGVLLIIRPYQKISGQLFWIYVFFYGSLHFVSESFRGDSMDPILLGIYSYNQLISLILTVLAVFIMLNYLFFNKEKKDAQDYNQ